MKFTEFMYSNVMNEAISPETPLTRNQVRVALLKFKVNPWVANSVARRLTQKQLESPKELAIFMKQFNLSVEQTMDLVKFLASKPE